jgi:probable rRNA maturation factor
MIWEGACVLPFVLETEVIILEHETEGTSARALGLFAAKAQRAVGLRGKVNIRISTNRELQELNRRFCKKNKPTDVLSFPWETPKLAGDIAISGEIAAANAAELGHSPQAELKVLILHGLLHLAGYDHETDGGEMQARETTLRRKLGLPVGLIERAHSTLPKRPGGRKPSRKSAGSRSRGGVRK